MNEQAYQRDQEEYAQSEAEQEALREQAFAKYEDYMPLINEMIEYTLEVARIDKYNFLIGDKEKLEKYMSDGEWQEAITFMEKLLEG